MFAHALKLTLGVALVVLAAAIIIPKFVKARAPSPRGICIGNLKQIDGAIQQWAIENKMSETNAPDFSAAIKYLKNGELPKCPNGGTYSAGKTVWHPPTCSKANTLGHSLP